MTIKSLFWFMHKHDSNVVAESLRTGVQVKLCVDCKHITTPTMCSRHKVNGPMNLVTGRKPSAVLAHCEVEREAHSSTCGPAAKFFEREPSDWVRWWNRRTPRTEALVAVVVVSAAIGVIVGLALLLVGFS